MPADAIAVRSSGRAQTGWCRSSSRPGRWPGCRPGPIRPHWRRYFPFAFDWTGVPNATNRIPTGTLLEVDGSSGKVTVLEGW